MFPSSRRRLIVLVRRTAAAGTNPLQPQPQTHATILSRRYSSAPVARTPDREPCSATASYLASCGLSPAAADALASRGIRIVSTAKADAVLALLRGHGFRDAHIARLLRVSPAILTIDPDKILRPKLEFFASLGFTAGFLAGKGLLERSLGKHIIPSVEFLRDILGTDANIRLAVSRHPYSLLFDLEKSMRPALQALRRHGLSEEVILKLILLNMGVLRMTPDSIASTIEDLDALGLPITDSRFIYAFRAKSTISKEGWLQKMMLYQSLGVSEGELLKAFKKQPTIVLYSEESIKKKLRFFMDELKLDLSDVMAHPVVLGYSFEKCILPRCAVLSMLMREGKIERDIKLLRALLGSSNKFSKRYVLRYANDVPGIVEAYEGKIEFKGFGDQMF